MVVQYSQILYRVLNMIMSSFLPQTSIFEFKESEENQLDFLNAYNEKLDESLDVKEQSELKNIEYQLPWSGSLITIFTFVKTDL